MPVYDGLQALSAIRKAEEDGRQKSCVFIITAHESPELVEHIEGADDFISKPCSAKLIKQLLERHHLLTGVVYNKQNVLIVSRDTTARSAITLALHGDDITSLECASFVDAENAALASPFNAVVSDIPTIVKSKGDEQLAAFSLQNIYPFVRVKLIEGQVIPIIMSGDREQSAVDYLEKICFTSHPRRLRTYKRHNMFIPVIVTFVDGQIHQAFTLDVSWGGAFVVINNERNIESEKNLLVEMPTLNVTIAAEVIRVQAWGTHGVAPGLGFKWKSKLDAITEQCLGKILNLERNNDRDRLLG
jgi:hypothetical protein